MRSIGLIIILGFGLPSVLADWQATLGPSTAWVGGSGPAGQFAGGSVGVDLRGLPGGGGPPVLRLGPAGGQSWSVGDGPDAGIARDLLGRTFALSAGDLPAGTWLSARLTNTLTAGPPGPFTTTAEALGTLGAPLGTDGRGWQPPGVAGSELTAATRRVFARYVAGDLGGPFGSGPGLDPLRNSALQAFFWDQQQLRFDGQAWTADHWRSQLAAGSDGATATEFYDHLDSLGRLPTIGEDSVRILRVWSGNGAGGRGGAYLVSVIPAPGAGLLAMVGLGLLGRARRN